MKKLLLFPLLCFTSCAFAQKSFFGVDAGINVANQRDHVLFTYSPIPSPNSQNSAYLNIFYGNTTKASLGFFYHFGFNEKIGLRLNARYMGLGYNSDVQNVSINYLTFPLSLHYSLTNHLCLNAGPYLSFTIGGANLNGQDITKTYHKNDTGISFGGEHDIYKNFAIGVNYLVGLKNIWLDDQNGTFKYTNRALQLTLIYKFKKTN
jgi:hypothetical protein